MSSVGGYYLCRGSTQICIFIPLFTPLRFASMPFTYFLVDWRWQNFTLITEYFTPRNFPYLPLFYLFKIFVYSLSLNDNDSKTSKQFHFTAHIGSCSGMSVPERIFAVWFHSGSRPRQKWSVVSILHSVQTTLAYWITLALRIWSIGKLAVWNIGH